MCLCSAELALLPWTCHYILATLACGFFCFESFPLDSIPYFDYFFSTSPHVLRLSINASSLEWIPSIDFVLPSVLVRYIDHIFAGILDAHVCLLNQAFEVRKQVLFLFITPSEVWVPALWGPSFKLPVVMLPTSSFHPPTLGMVTVPCSYISVSRQCCPSGISNSPLPGWLFFILNSLH